MPIEQVINTGVLIAPPLPTDYIRGQTSPLNTPVINPSGDNRPYKPDPEWQTGPGGDKMDCVTVSSAGAIETVLNLLLKTGQMSIGNAQWLHDQGFIQADGLVHISTRWGAIQNGTTQNGNYLNVVAQWWHTNGIIPETLLPNDQSLNWQQYYDTSCLTDQMRAIAKESLNRFNINYEWVYGDDNTLKEDLKYGEIQLATAVCQGWTNGGTTPVPACNQQVQHATELMFIDINNIRHIFDSYDPFNKQLASDYPLPYRMLYIISEKKGQETMHLTIGADGVTYYLEGNKGKLGFADPASLAKIQSLSDEQPQPTNPAVPQKGIFEQGIVIHN